MNPQKIGTVVFIFVVTSVAWLLLGGFTMSRSENTYSRLGMEYTDGPSEGKASVRQLWGSPQVQYAPQVWSTYTVKQSTVNDKGKTVVQNVEKQDPVVLTKSRIGADIESEPRRKGLLWYSTYRVKFNGEYAFKNDSANERKFLVKFTLPSGQAAFDNVLFFVNGKRTYPSGNVAEGLTAPVTLKPGENATLRMAYGSQGMDTWRYKFGQEEAVSSVPNFEARVVTNCSEVDFPASCLSPTHKNLNGKGWDLTWKYGDLISGSSLGLSIPHNLNPGPLAGRLSLFAPVSLFFFFAVLLILGAVGNIRLHPMHYVMLAAAFFSFHLLFSYTVDHLTPFYAFLLSSAVSMLLTVSYLRLVAGWKFAVFQAGIWQFVFLVLFAYAFFFEGYTGLTITVGVIVTLAVLMHLTAHVNWEEALAGRTPPQTERAD